jgi:effector-binding domain-containing protein
MTDTPQIMKTFAQPAAVIQLTIPREKMMTEFGPAIEEILTILSAQFVEPAGPVFAHHFKMTPGQFDFEMGFPINGTITNEGRVRLSELPARAKVAHTVYRGPYDGLPGAWGEFTAWMEAQGLKQAEDLWEIYAYGPESNPDPATWRTELYRPLKD